MGEKVSSIKIIIIKKLLHMLCAYMYVLSSDCLLTRSNATPRFLHEYLKTISNWRE